MILKRKHIDFLYENSEKNEEWSNIPGYDKYMVSNMGRVLGLTKTDIMTGELTDKGYLRVPLKNEDGKRKVRVHRLVAEAFLPEVEGKDQIDHKDGCKINNKLSNLRWVDNGENQRASVKKGEKKKKGDPKNQSARYRLKKRQEKFNDLRAQELEEKRNRKPSA